MTQHDILFFLSKFPDKKFTVKEITKKLNVMSKSIGVSLLKLRYYGEVNYEIIPRNNNSLVPYYRYWYKKEDGNK